MSSAIITAAASLISGAMDLFDGDRKRQAEALLKEMDAEQARMVGQLEVNKAESAHSSVFVAGWRPAIGWVGATALAIEFVVRPLLMWVSVLWMPTLPSLPSIVNDNLWCLLCGLLGLGGLRTFEKAKGKAR